MESIETRLLRLEKSNRLYKRTLVTLAAVFAIGLMAFNSKFSPPDVLQAKKFEVLDDYGNVMVAISQDKQHGMIKTYNSAGNKLVNITYTTKNEGYIGLEDGTGKENIRMSSNNDYGGGYLSLFNPNSQRVISMYNDNGGGTINVNNGSGTNQLVAKSHSDGGGYLGILNASGNYILSLMQTTNGNGDLYVNNNYGDQRLRFSVSPAGGNMQLFNNSKTMAGEIGVTSGQNGVMNTYNSSGGYIQGIGGQ
jgi:hypothetical protein